MKKLIAFLLFFPLSAMAELLPSDTSEFIHEVQNLVKIERVTIRKGNSLELEDVGLLIPSKEILSSSTELTEGGRLALEKAGSFAKRTKRKLTILVPDEREHKDFRPVVYFMHDIQMKRNAFIGQNVYIVITRN